MRTKIQGTGSLSLQQAQEFALVIKTPCDSDVGGPLATLGGTSGILQGPLSFTQAPQVLDQPTQKASEHFQIPTVTIDGAPATCWEIYI